MNISGLIFIVSFGLLSLSRYISDFICKSLSSKLIEVSIDVSNNRSILQPYSSIPSIFCERFPHVISIIRSRMRFSSSVASLIKSSHLRPDCVKFSMRWLILVSEPYMSLAPAFTLSTNFTRSFTTNILLMPTLNDSTSLSSFLIILGSNITELSAVRLPAMTFDSILELYELKSCLAAASVASPMPCFDV